MVFIAFMEDQLEEILKTNSKFHSKSSLIPFYAYIDNKENIEEITKFWEENIELVLKRWKKSFITTENELSKLFTLGKFEPLSLNEALVEIFL